MDTKVMPSLSESAQEAAASAEEEGARDGNLDGMPSLSEDAQEAAASAEEEGARDDTPYVSIIVPVYNGEAYLRRCLNCLVSQTVQNIEIIVVNDGSTDGTQDIIDEFRQKYPEKLVAVTQANAGVSAARNHALSMARGTYIAFVDADDRVSLQFCEHMLWNIRKTKSDLAECGRIDVLTKGNTVIERPVPSCKEHVIDMTKKLTLNKGSLFVWDKLFRKDIIDRIGLRFVSHIKYGEDGLFLQKYKMHCRRISFVHKNLYYYTESRSDSATSTNKNAMDLIPCMEKMIEEAFHAGRHREAISEIGDIAAGYYVRRLWSLAGNADPRVFSFADSFLEFFRNYIPNWKIKICKYKAHGSKIRIFLNRYRLSIFGVKMFCMYMRMSSLYKKIINGICATPGIVKKYCKNHAVIDKYINYCSMKINDNDVLFVSFFGSSISDSMFYMIKSMQERGKNIIIGTNYKERDRYFCKVNGIKAALVKVNSPDYLKALACSKYLVLNSRFPTYFNKRDGQVLLNTWHGTPLKTLGRGIKRGLSDLGNNQCQFLMSDYLSFPNDYTKQHTLRDFSLDKLFCGKSVLCGYPRNAVFFHTEHIKELKEKLGVADKRVFMYMPTWRGETLDTRSVQKYEKEVVRILGQLDKNVDDDVVIFVKLHQVVMNKIHLASYKHIRSFDSSYDTYYFLSAADCLITDYSSVMFDFVNADKPIMLFMYDYEAYQSTRGTYMDVKSLSFEQSFTVEELIEYIHDFRPGRHVYEEEKRIYCNYDSIDTPDLLNDVLLTGEEKAQVKIEDHGISPAGPYNMYLMPQLTREENVKRFLEIKEKDSHALFVFAQDTFTRKTEKMLQKYNDEITYIITPIRGIHSTGQLIRMQLALWNIPVDTKKLFKEDVNRICRGVHLGEIVNLSKYKWFKFLGKCSSRH